MSLESRYRRLLHAYPKVYREHRGEEMLATLLDGATPEQVRPTRQETFDLVAGGLRERLGLNALPGLVVGLRIAGPIGLVAATVHATIVPVNGPVTVMSTVVATAWILALVARQTVPRLAAAPILAWLVTAIVAAIAAIAPSFNDRPWLYVVPLATGLLAAAGALMPRSRPSTVEQVSTLLATVGVLALAVTAPAESVMPGAGLGRIGVPTPSQLYVAAMIAVLAVGPFIPRVIPHGGWRWAAGALFVPLPLLDSFYRWQSFVERVPATQLVVLAGFTVCVYLAAQNAMSPQPDGTAAMRTAARLGLGLAGGAGLGIIVANLPVGITRGNLAALALPALAVFTVLVLPPQWRAAGGRVAIGCALVGLIVVLGIVGSSGPATAATTVVVLLAVALVAGAATPVVPTSTGVGFGAAVGVLLALGLATLRIRSLGWGFFHTTGVLVMVAAVVVVPAVWWSATAIVRAERFWPGPVLATTAGLLYLLYFFSPVEQPWLLVATVGATVGILLAVRTRHVTASAPTAETAPNASSAPDGPTAG